MTHAANIEDAVESSVVMRRDKVAGEGAGSGFGVNAASTDQSLNTQVCDAMH